MTVPVHPICHRALHSHFTNSALARVGNDLPALLENEGLSRFVTWVRKQPPDFHAPTRTRR